MRVKTSFGNHPASSHSLACGRSSLATNRRIASRSCSCSSVNGGIGRRALAAVRPLAVRLIAADARACGGGARLRWWRARLTRRDHVAQDEADERLRQIPEVGGAALLDAGGDHLEDRSYDREGEVGRERLHLRVRLCGLA